MKTLFIAAALLAGSLSIGTAEAMPSGTIKVDSNVIRVDYACGRGWHVTRWGECRRNWRRPSGVVFYYGGPPRRGWDRPRRDWDGPGWRHERRWDHHRRWRDDD